MTDDEHLREEASFGFPADVRVTFSEDATSAWRHLEQEVPSLVIVTLRTGNSGGFALALDMAQRNDLREVPVMMILERDQDAWLARQSGCALFRTKPLNPGQLVADAFGLMNRKQAS